MKKKSVLLFIKIPPPITGATLMNKRVLDSELLRQYFNIRTINISYSKNTKQLGNISLNKLFTIFKVGTNLFLELLIHRPSFVYFQISPLGITFIRDVLFVSIIKFFRVKILYHLHGKGIKQVSQNKILQQLYKYSFNGSDVICLSKSLKYDIEDIHSGKTYCVYNGIPDIDLSNLAKTIRVNNSEVHILFLSNLMESKGIFDLLEAIKILDSSCDHPFSVIIVGNEGDISSAELKSNIKNKGIESRINYLGSKYGEDKFNIIKNSDIFVFPTKNDAFGIVLLEAMQLSIPIVATYEGTIPEIIDNNISGFLINKASPEELADKLRILIKDKNLRNKMGNAARKKYEAEFTFNKFENNIFNVFNEVSSCAE